MFLGGLLAVSLTGCAFDGDPAEKASSNPYADVFQEELPKVKDKKVRGYLEDGKISEQEFQAVTSKLSACVSGSGITFNGYDDHGQSSFEGDPSKIANKDLQGKINACEESSGDSVVSYLYFMVKRDPSRKITDETYVNCFIRSGLVPPEFTAKDYAGGELYRLYPNEKLFEPGGEEAQAKIQNCQADPLGAYVGK